MSRPWETDCCETIRAYRTYYYVPQAAALWCNVPPERLQEILDQAIEIERNIFRHPAIPGLEPRCRAIHHAIESDRLWCGSEGRGRYPYALEHVDPEMRTVQRTDLREWIPKEFPGDRPPFLFSDTERDTPSGVSANDDRNQKAENDKLRLQLTKLTTDYETLRLEKEDLERLNESLKAIADRPKQPGERAETTYLNIIGAMLDLMLGKSPGGQAYSVFNSQAAIISKLLDYHRDKPGISARTLEDKFAEAKRNLRGSA